MKFSLQVSFHNMEHSDVIEQRVIEEAAKLDEFCDHIMSCRVVIDIPHRHHQHGNLYQVRIDITARGEEIAVVHEPAEHLPSYKDVNVAIRDAFDSAARQIEDYVRRQRGDVKHHEVPAHGRIAKLFPEKSYGFIETPESLEIYFHAHSLVGHDFKDLKLGTEVSFVEELGEKGPQASTVHLVGEHHHIG